MVTGKGFYGIVRIKMSLGLVFFCISVYLLVNIHRENFERR